MLQLTHVRKRNDSQAKLDEDAVAVAICVIAWSMLGVLDDDIRQVFGSIHYISMA